MGINVRLDVLRFVEGGLEKVLGSVNPDMIEENSKGVGHYFYSGSLGGCLSCDLTFDGYLGKIGEGVGRSNFNLLIDREHIFYYLGFFTDEALVVEFPIQATGCSVRVNVSLEE